MSSSSRIIRPGSVSTATSERARADELAGTVSSSAGGDPARTVPVLRGNTTGQRHGGNLPPTAGAARGANGEWAAPIASGSLAATVAWALAPRASNGTTRRGTAGAAVQSMASDGPPIDLLQAQRIADQRGYAAGNARATTELAAAIASVGVLAQRLEAVAPVRTTAVARAIADVAIAVARRIVGTELRHDPALLVHSIEAAVGMINGSPEARVIVHPSAVEPIRSAWEAAHGSTHLGKRWTFEGDDGYAPGDCILRFDHGFVDAGVEAQLAEIERAIEGAIPGLWSGTPVNGDTLIPEAGR